MSDLLCFDCFEVDLSGGQVRKRGARIGLRDQPFKVLAALLEHPGQVVTREDLRRRLWPDDVVVDFDNGLNIAIARLRTALGDSAERPRFIETLPKRGYRFIGAVSPRRMPPQAGTAGRPRLVVLPFLNLSGDPVEDFVSDAATDEIITELAALAPDHLGVIARTTAMRYKRARKDVAQCRRELNVDYVVDGGVHRTGDRLSITVQLVRAVDQTHLFARSYEAGVAEVFELRAGSRVTSPRTSMPPGSPGKPAAGRPRLTAGGSRPRASRLTTSTSKAATSRRR